MAVQTTSIHTLFADALDLTNSAENTVIAPGVTLASDFEDGVVSKSDAQTLINHGSIIATENATSAVVFGQPASLVVNAPDGSITGYVGVEVGDGDSAINFGSI
jgi:hypothetical protein